jgi:hypothetical protein
MGGQDGVRPCLQRDRDAVAATIPHCAEGMTRSIFAHTLVVLDDHDAT